MVTDKITVNGNVYLRMYNSEGEINNAGARAMFGKKEFEEAIVELQKHELMEIIENRGEKYFRLLEPKTESIPFNVLNY
ncbi:hypothetical protein CD133_11265 [Staphylococcus massiliensis CCUG 55927]|uniref:hypothetical protein n=1 Tax=Staphylococcus massiliensis TaxID=555791 RepID=UPI0002E537B0|nr:hypothetical protein [Staphylococcus massiliensis]MCG3402933.1 hypothetical protein [Staphylococcus massiliensis]PNZ96960.1 hypothetical protein CD133_11265 [Staphylococcus massiliensis CCUG 55927]